MLIFESKFIILTYQKKLHNRTDVRHTASRLLARAASEDKTWCSIGLCSVHGRASNYRNIKAVNLTLLGRTHARTQQVPEAYIHDIQVEQDWNAIRTNSKFSQICC